VVGVMMTADDRKRMKLTEEELAKMGAIVP
jgi:hypothetical protein